MNKKFAVVFPGQGSQAVGMVNSLAEAFPSIRQRFSEASSVLDYDLWELVSQGPAEELNKTEKTQPALLVTSYAIWQILSQQKNFKPHILAGHSLGEYTALVCADAIEFKVAVDLVAKRGRYMQEAVAEGEGAMAAIIGLDDGRVDEICEKVADNEVLASANYNSIGQVVIAGHKDAIERAIQMANDAGAKLAKILQISVPCHCLLMQPAAKQLAEKLDKISLKPPKYPIINNVDVAIYSDPLRIKDALIRQLYNPVKWVDTIRKMTELGIHQILECGPSRVLCGLNKRIDRDIECIAVNDLESIAKTQQS